MVIIVKNESILNTFSSSLFLNYLNESHGGSKGIVLKSQVIEKNDIFVQKLLIWKLFLEFFENLVKRDFLFRIWIIGNLVYVKTCYSIENVKSLPMTKKPKFHDHEPLKSFLIDDLRKTLWNSKCQDFFLIDMIWTILDPKENPFNVFLFSTCTYLENGTLSQDTLWNSIGWPKWMNKKRKKVKKKWKKWKKEKMIFTSCTEIFN